MLTWLLLVAPNVASAAGCDTAVAVRINEFLPDPDGSDGSVLAEWVELYNASAVAVDVSGWELQRGKSAATPYSTKATIPGGTVIPARGFYVIGEGLVGGADLTVAGTLDLGNASDADALRILDCLGTVRDTVVYGDDNSVDAWEDDIGGVATSLVAMAGSGQSIGRVIDGVDTDECGLDFVVYPFPTVGLSNTTPPPECGGPGSGIVVNELLVNPAGSDGDAGTEFVELYHAGAGELDLSGWSIVSRTSASSATTQFTFPDGTLLAPREHLVVADFAWPADFSEALTLPSGSNGDSVSLLDCLGVPADIVVYGDSNDDLLLDESGAVAVSFAGKPGDDEVLARLSDGFDTNLSGDDFVLHLDATPGAANPPFEPVVCVPSAGGVVINELLPDPKGTDTGNEWVELYNRTGAPVDVSGWGLVLAGDGKSAFDVDLTLPGGTVIPADGYLLLGGSKVAGVDVITSASVGNGTDGDLARLLDCDGNVVDSVVWGSAKNEDLVPDDVSDPSRNVPAAPGSAMSLARAVNGLDTDDCTYDFVEQGTVTPGGPNPEVTPPTCTPSAGGDVVVNEVMANPDGSDTDLEWIELYNKTNAAVPVEGWGLAFGSNADNQDDIDVTLPSGAVVPPRGYLVVMGAKAGLGGLVADFSLGNGTAGDSVRLFDCDGVAVDTVAYGDPKNADGVGDDRRTPATSLAPTPGDGEALARVSDGFDTDDSGVDFAATLVATPGAANEEIEPVVCAPGLPRAVVINELLTNPTSTDDGFEWVELYNPGSAAVSLDGWGLIFATQGDDWEDAPDYLFPGGISLAPGGFLVVGGEFSVEADLIGDVSLGNGTGGDGVRLVDCEGARIDTVVYGSDNEDLVPDDVGATPDPPSPEPEEAQSLARVEDGVDQDDVGDWFVDVTPTPGETNYQEPIVVPPVEQRGCGKGGPAETDNKGCGKGADVPNNGCSSVPLPLGGLELWAGLVVLLRRRRAP